MKLILESWRQYLNEEEDGLGDEELKLTRYSLTGREKGRGLFKYTNQATKRIDDEEKTNLPSPYTKPPSPRYEVQYWFTDEGLDRYHEFVATLIDMAEEAGGKVEKQEMSVGLGDTIADYDLPRAERSSLSQVGLNFSRNSRIPGIGFLAYKDPWQVAFYILKKTPR